MQRRNCVYALCVGLLTLVLLLSISNTALGSDASVYSGVIREVRQVSPDARMLILEDNARFWVKGHLVVMGERENSIRLLLTDLKPGDSVLVIGEHNFGVAHPTARMIIRISPVVK